MPRVEPRSHTQGLNHNTQYMLLYVLFSKAYLFDKYTANTMTDEDERTKLELR